MKALCTPLIVYQALYQARQLLEQHLPDIPMWMLLQLAGELRAMLARVDAHAAIQEEAERATQAYARTRGRRWN